jgi:feruloyl esterase
MWCFGGVLPAVIVAAALLAAPARAAVPADCAALAGLAVPDTTITSATLVGAGDTLPEYCRIQGHVDTEINFELRLPTSWNGKFLFQGFGGLDGAPPSQTQGLGLGSPGAPLGLQRGYAVVTTDTGHQLPPDITSVEGYGGWAFNNPERQTNWAHRSTHVVAGAAKSIITGYFGREARFSYYQGCSGGGRHAAMAAQRYPTDFDGVVSAAPFLKPTRQSVAWNWIAQSETPAIPLAKLQLVRNAVLAECDAADGLEDGLLDDPRRCKFNPRKLQCKDGDGADCLTAGEVSTLRRIYTGPVTAAGERPFPGFARGGEDRWIPGLIAPPGGRSSNDRLHEQILRGFVFGPDYDTRTFDIDRDIPLLDATADLVDVKPDLSGFQAAGGKILMWHGWDDARLSPAYSIQFRDEVIRALGRDTDLVDGFFKLFMAPGVGHCAGGPGPNSFDALDALEGWVERGINPGSLLATHRNSAGEVDRTRPLCPYPQVAAYDGSGSIDDANNFYCRDERRHKGGVKRGGGDPGGSRHGEGRGRHSHEDTGR